MKIYVKLFATLTQNLPEAVLACYPQARQRGVPIEIELPEGSTLADLIANLALPREEIKLTFVNGRAQELDYHLQPGDEVGMFPPIGGG